jgi:hypothetical protein
MTSRSEFQHYPNRMRFGDEILFGKSKVTEGSRIVLTKCNIHVVSGGEFRNESPKDCRIT